MSAEPDQGDTSIERLTPIVRRLVLLRHGQTSYNATRRMQGHLDTELSERGIAQAQAAAQVLAACGPRLIRSSDLQRAHHTALALGAATGLQVTTDQRLRETHLGQWQGLSHAEVDAQAPGARRIWRDDATWAPPGGESRVQVAARAVPVVTQLLTELDDWGQGQTPEAPVILVAHGGVIAALTAGLLGLPVANWPMLGGLANTSWVQLSGHSLPGAEPTWRLDVWNASAEVADTGVQ
ncbi:phosphoglycerate mutase family protein [Gordonia hirsuta DSM 44140 = NBRC 16056]|uniref:Phosphoglycerate mutase family protein n=1 Tax=Gordonia hirsuta DSM 44140 = NBRC 16056 TaxID=1121927 RepID=L7L8G7_9ACTN|nr:histidine phosphatase family protein [Gordonia hirsuta]GAC57219.1 phosphoglycerate mutase family protein [Gordonia hirsuta DSM 44140 = NBRC 16056]